MTTRQAAAAKLRDVNPLAAKIFDTGTVHGGSGEPVEVHSQLSELHADALYATVLAQRPQVVVEVGMAFGLSSLAILTALRDAGGTGRLISIDPYQSTTWRGIGTANVERAGLSGMHELMETPDYLGLPRLLEARTRVDFGYIDGWHTFDYTLLDFWYLDRMVPQGGVVAFNDAGLRAVHRVMRFVRTHRRYRELNVGLRPSYRGRNPVATLQRRLTGRQDADRYFQKVEEWEPAWNFYAPF